MVKVEYKLLARLASRFTDTNFDPNELAAVIQDEVAPGENGRMTAHAANP